MARNTTLALYASIALLMLSCALEMASISSMVYWVHYRASKAFSVNYNNTTVSLHGKPLGLLVDQGHTSNGAAGTGFVAVGLGGILALWLRHRNARRTTNPGPQTFAKFTYDFWLTMTLLNLLLTLAALIYTMDLTASHAGQKIDIALAPGLHNEPYPKYVANPLQFWTPENWFTAVLELPLARSSDRSDTQTHVAVMKGWRWNLTPMLIFQSAVFVFAVMDWRATRREVKRFGDYEAAGVKRVSA